MDDARAAGMPEDGVRLRPRHPSNLWAHMRTVHGLQRPKHTTRKRSDPSDGPRTSAQPDVAKRQRDMRTFADRPMSPAEHRATTLTLARFTYRKALPFSTFVGEEADKLFSVLRPGYKPHESASTFRNEALDTIFEEECDKMLVALNKSEYYTLAVDGASRDRGQAGHLISFVAHTASETFLVDCAWCTSSQTADIIAGLIRKALNGSVLAETDAKLAAITTDGGANYAKARDIVAQERNAFGLTCACHGANLAMGDIMKLPHFGSVLEDAKAVARALRKDRARVIMDAESELTVDLPTTTRWNSQYTIMKKLLRPAVRHAAIKIAKRAKRAWAPLPPGTRIPAALKASRKMDRAISNDVAKLILDTKFWKSMKAVCQIVAPLARFILELQCGHVEAADVAYEYYAGHVPRISEQAEETLPAESHEAVKAILDHRKPRLCPPFCELAYLLSPRHRAAAFRARGFASVRSRVLLALFPGTSREQVDRRVSLYMLIGKFAAKAWIPNVSTQFEWTDANTANAREWWKTDGEIVSELKPLAAQVFAVHVTSVGCERAFSVATRQLAPARARLTPARHRKLTIIAMNNAARRAGGHADETAYSGDRADSAFDLVSDAEDGEDADEDVDMPVVDGPVAAAAMPLDMNGGFMEGEDDEDEEQDVEAVEVMPGFSGSEEEVEEVKEGEEKEKEKEDEEVEEEEEEEESDIVDQQVMALLGGISRGAEALQAIRSGAGAAAADKAQ